MGSVETGKQPKWRFFLQKVSWSNGTSTPNLWFKAFKITIDYLQRLMIFRIFPPRQYKLCCLDVICVCNTSKLWLHHHFFQHLPQPGQYPISFGATSSRIPLGYFPASPTGSSKLTEFKSLVNLLALPCSGRCMLKFKDKKSWEVSIGLQGRKLHFLPN